MSSTFLWDHIWLGDGGAAKMYDVKPPPYGETRITVELIGRLRCAMCLVYLVGASIVSPPITLRRFNTVIFPRVENGSNLLASTRGKTKDDSRTDESICYTYLIAVFRGPIQRRMI